MVLTDDEIKQIKNSIERIPQFEEKLGIELKNISVKVEDDAITVYGEFFMEDTKGNNWAYLDCTLHDDENRIVDRREHSINLGNFLGFVTFEILFWPMDPTPVRKVRIYPKL